MYQKSSKMVFERMKLFHDSLKKKFFDDSIFLNFCLQFCRIFFIEHDRISFKIKLLLTFLYFSSISVNCLGAIVSLINISNVIEKLEIFLILSLHVTSFGFFVFFKMTSKKIWIMFQQPFQTDSPVYVGKEATAIASKILRKSIIALFLVNSGIIVSSVFLTVLCAAFIDANDSSGDSKLVKFLIPYWFECGTPSVVKFCLEVHTDTRLWIINFIQMVSLLYEVNLNLSVLLFYLILTSGVQARAEIFKVKLSTLSEQISHLNVSKAHFLNKRFGQIVGYQVEIRKFVGDLKTLINFPMLLHVQSFYALTVLAAFLLLTKGTDNVLILMKTLYFIVLGTVFHYVICQNSTIISHMNQNLSSSLMDFPWYEQDAKFRKSYLLTLSANQKPLSVKLYGLYHVDLRYFASNMRRIYSLLNILLLFQRKLKLFE